jgi:hypothetical protein
MARFGLCGSSYASQSFNADAQVLRNMYLEQIESPDGKSAGVIYPTPGTRLFAQLPDSPVRGTKTAAGRTFAVAGSTFFEVFVDGTFKTLGSVANDGNPVSFAEGPLQLLMASNQNGYVFTYADNSFQSNPANLVSPLFVGYSDGFFVSLQANSNKWQVSGLLDASSWDAGDVSLVSVFPGNIIAMAIDHREIWLCGDKKCVGYYNSGAIFPFDVIPGAYIESGIGSPYSICKLDNTLFWWEADERGKGIARRAQGYVPTRVSNHAIELAVQGYPTIADAVSYSYQDQGHSFWVTRFPSANNFRGATWVYDVATQEWHERDYFINGQSYAHLGTCHAFAFGKHLIGDWQSGNIYQMSIPVSSAGGWLFADDSGNPIRRMRRTPYVSAESQYIYFNSLEIEAEMGLNSVTAQAFTNNILLADANGVVWSVGINDDGTISTTQTTGAATTLTLNDPSNTTSWAVQVTIGGILTTTAAAFKSSNPFAFSFLSASGKFNYQLLVTATGLLQTDEIRPALRGPQIMLRWSDDGAKTWSNEHWMSLGKTGDYSRRAIKRRMGKCWGTRGRIFEITYTDAVPLRIVDGYLSAEPGFGPTPRISSQLRKGA